MNIDPAQHLITKDAGSTDDLDDLDHYLSEMLLFCIIYLAVRFVPLLSYHWAFYRTHRMLGYILSGSSIVTIGVSCELLRS